LLPGFQIKQVEVVGNTSLAGAYLGLLDCGALDEITRISKKIEIIELNSIPVSSPATSTNSVCRVECIAPLHQHSN